MPTKLEIYNNRTPLDLHPVDIEKADNLLRDIVDNLQFFRIRLQENPTMIDSHTHMGLFEHKLTELAPIVKYDSVLKEEQEKRYAEIRNANMEIRRLNMLLGNGISPEGISAKLRDYDNAIRNWYGAHGFQYASLKEYTAYGIIYEFNDELQYEPDNGCSNRKEWTETFTKTYKLIAKDNTIFDIYRDTYHAELLDTDKNKKLITDLITKSFPEAQIREFRSRMNDFNSYSLRFTVYLPYSDIHNMITSVIPDFET